MIVKAYYTDGKKHILEREYDLAEPKNDEIQVKSVYTGICSSDIAMYEGAFPLLPLDMHGHESVGIVTKIGKDIFNVKEGDYVATRGEPAFSEFYNARVGTFLSVPVLDPAYIIEPVACAYNIARHAFGSSRVCILGTGYLALWVARFLRYKTQYQVTVVGTPHSDMWRLYKEDLGDYQFINSYEYQKGDQYDVIIDLSDKHWWVITEEKIAPNGKIIVGANKNGLVNVNFSKLLWNNVSVLFPSPRGDDFISYMRESKDFVEQFAFSFARDTWTHEYKASKIKRAFREALNKTPNQIRSYINWS